MCFNKDCQVRLACKYCFGEKSFHQGHINDLQSFDVIPVRNKTAFDEYKKLFLQERITK